MCFQSPCVLCYQTPKTYLLKCQLYSYTCDGTVLEQFEDKEEHTGKLNRSFSFRASRFVNAVLISGLHNLTGTPSRGTVGFDSDLPGGSDNGNSDFTLRTEGLLFVRTV